MTNEKRCQNCEWFAGWPKSTSGICHAPLPEWLNTENFREPVMSETEGRECHAYKESK